MDAASIATALNALVPGASVEALAHGDQPTVAVPPSRWPAVAVALRDDAGLAFTALVDIAGVDLLPKDPRFELNYHLVAPDLHPPARLRVKIAVGGADPRVPTATDVWPAANFLEREVWDLMGVVFSGHPDLRRLLTPEDWEGHPQRKDYPVQVNRPVKTDEAIQLTAEQFRANIRRDRAVREDGSR
ncbi:MAG: NADH-quinone oxidoreductase subunit C [Acidobacteriota bacterium]